MLFISLFLCAALMLSGLVFVSLLVSKPIKKLADSMVAVEKGEFKEVAIKTGNDEIGTLKDGYNIMIREIQNLINNIVKEHQVKRQKELEVLQSQIKPHFLYNSFDAISSLALSGANQEAYKTVRALGQFYKAFLYDGKENITIKEELDIVRHYLTIQQIRFKDEFTVKENYDERTFGCVIPRLTLQPLVENAINHGIRAQTGAGVIAIESVYNSGTIQLKVSDNGAGMTAQKVAEIKDGRSHGVGLCATVERLNIYFCSTDIFDIRSEPGKGTEITITIPMKQE